MEGPRPRRSEPETHKSGPERSAGPAGHHDGERGARCAMQQEDQRSQDPGAGKLQARAAQGCAKTSVALVPPKPTELESATRIDILRAAFGT